MIARPQFASIVFDPTLSIAIALRSGKDEKMATAAITRPYYNRMMQKLKKHFNPMKITLEDQSAQHAGHAENSGLGETHFR